MAFIQGLQIVPVGSLLSITVPDKEPKVSSDPVVRLLVQLGFAHEGETKLKARDMAAFFANAKMKERMAGRQQPDSNGTEDRAKWFRIQYKRDNLKTFME